MILFHSRRSIGGLVACALLAIVPCAASATPYTPAPPFSAIYETYNPSITDHLYTMDYAEALSSTSGAGYTNLWKAFYLERTPQAHTKPLYRYVKGAPQTEHLFITDTYPQDLAEAQALGYFYEGITGYLYRAQVPGSLPLYRLSRGSPKTDRTHKFVTTDSEKNALIAQGWTFDHIEGYVPGTTLYWPPNANIGIQGFPLLPNGHVLTRRCQNTPLQVGICVGSTFRNGYFGYKTVLSTFKPAGATKQVMAFDLWSPDYFDQPQSDHIAIGLHGRWDIDFGDIDNVSNLARNHHALGIAIGAFEKCGMTVRVEAFWPVDNNVSECTGQAQLENNRLYRFRIVVTDKGEIEYAVTPGHTDIATPIIHGRYNGNAYFNGSYAFPTQETGYFIATATLSEEDYTVYMSNLTVAWE